jgi:2-polyprenyl-3-methyl-5-hydroxy-6-metoxy-1,4-benzoquinol methylase
MSLIRLCPQCGSTSKKKEGNFKGKWHLAKCNDCYFVYLGSTPTYEELSKEYEWSNSFQGEKKRREDANPLFNKIDRITRFRTSIFPKTHPMKFVRKHFSSGKIIDLGCGSGGYLSQNADGFQLYGVDISNILIREAEKVFSKTGGKAISGPCHEVLQDFNEGFFDAVIMRSYLEHEYQPRLVLDESYRVLRPNGIVVVKVPNYSCWNRHIMRGRWCGFRFPDHVNYFTPDSLKSMSTKLGFSFSISFVDRLPFDDNFWAILKKPAV